MNNVYIGERYVPKYEGNYDSLRSYKSLSIVLYTDGCSYTSKKDVPAGIVPTNTEYWALTGDPLRGVEDLREQIDNVESEVDDLSDTVTAIGNANESIITPEKYGAVGDGIADDTAALQSAINECANTRKKLLLNAKTYCVTNTLHVEEPIVISGIGTSNDEVGTNRNPITTIKAISVIHGPILRYNTTVGKTLGGGALYNIAFDCNDLAAIGVELYYTSNMIVEQIAVMSHTSIGLSLLEGSYFNRFISLNIGSIEPHNTYAIKIDGTLDNNCCHNSFIGARLVWFGNKDGLYVSGDNNTFYDIFLFAREGTTGYGVSVGNGPNPAKSDNVFYHLQASARGMICKTQSYNTVFYYSTDNGEPLPVIESGGELTLYNNNKIMIRQGGNSAMNSHSTLDLMSTGNGGAPSLISDTETLTVKSLSGVELSVGIDAPSGRDPYSWIQSKHDANNGLAYELHLQPAGGDIVMKSIPTFTDNASAISAGKIAGTLYKHNDGSLHVVV